MQRLRRVYEEAANSNSELDEPEHPNGEAGAKLVPEGCEELRRTLGSRYFKLVDHPHGLQTTLDRELLPKCAQISPGAVDLVDQALSEIWIECPDHSFWSFNCLLYVGAQIISELGEVAASANPESQSDESEGENDPEEMDVLNTGDPSETFDESDPIEWDSGSESLPLPERKEDTSKPSAKHLRPILGWISAELQRRLNAPHQEAGA